MIYDPQCSLSPPPCTRVANRRTRQTGLISAGIFLGSHQRNK